MYKFLFTFIAMGSISGAVAQDRLEIPISKTYWKFDELIEHLEDSYKLIFSYSPSIIDGETDIRLDKKNYRLKALLDEVAVQANLEFKQQNGSILLKSKQISTHQITSELRGKVVDQYSIQPLIGASVKLVQDGPLQGDVTNLEGEFAITGLRPGRYTIQVSFVGYRTKVVSNILVTSNKQTYVNISLEEAVGQLKAVVLYAGFQKDEPLNEMALVSARSFSIDEASRFAGSFDDPARMALAYAGVQGGDDDIRNDIVVRGNAPKGLQWRLEGIEISNPNHFSDGLPSGGAVSMISSNILSNSDFLTGAFPVEYGNALSGVFDLKLRKGNSEEREYALQAGLLGIEGTAEGPFARDYNGSYLVNYRYSTLGLIGDLIDAQNSKYQDLSYNLSIPTKKIGVLGLFGILGSSSENEDEQSAFPPIGSFFPSKTQSGLSIFGIRNSLLISKSSWIRTALIYSRGSSILKTNNLGIIEQPGELPEAGLIRETNESKNETARTSIELNTKISSSFVVSIGIVNSWINYELKTVNQNNLINETSTRIDQQGATSLNQGYVNGKYIITNNFRMVGGVHTTRFGLNDSWIIEPRLSIQWQPFSNMSLSAGYGRHSRMEHLGLYLAEVQENNLTILPNKKLGLTQADHLVLGYQLKIKENTTFSIEGYWQELFNVPSGIGTISSVNFRGNELIDFELNNLARGINKGLDLSLERYINRGFYYLATYSRYSSTFRNEGLEYRTSFDGSYTSSFLLGREISLRNDKRMLILGSKLIANGGRPITPFDLQASLDSESVIEDETRFHTDRMRDYIRLDIQISYRINASRTTNFLKLDIQNVLNRKNQLERYFDSQSENVRWRVQNGILPVFSYKIQF